MKEGLNRALRRGLGRDPAPPKRRYRLPSKRLELREDIDLEHALHFTGELEDAKTARRSELRANPLEKS